MVRGVSVLPSTQGSVYLGTVGGVATPSDCAALCSRYVAGADNAGGAVVPLTQFEGTAMASVSGYAPVFAGALPASCVAASHYSAAKSAGRAGAGQDAAAFGYVCDLWAGMPAGASLLELHPEVDGADDAAATVLLDRWAALVR